MTYLGINTYALKIGGQRLLVDPVLTGDLVFFGQRWAFSGRRRADAPPTGIEPAEVPELFDAVVLSQGLEDHAHPGTLRQIPRGMRILASPRAAAVAQRLGFTNVTALAPGDSARLGDALQITAVPGSVVGPPWEDPENGYVFHDLRPGGLAIGAEPHGNFLGPAFGTSMRFLPKAPGVKIDALLAPLTSQSVAGYRLVNGAEEAITTLEALSPTPRFVLPLRNGEIESEGAIAGAMTESGSVPEFVDLLGRHPQLQAVRVLDIAQGEPVRIE